MNGLIRRRAMFESDVIGELMLQLLGNTSGNSNSTWADTSTYLTNATQATVGDQPTLTADTFGTGNYGYIFNSAETDFMSVADTDSLSFTDGVTDLPFTIKFKMKLTTISTQAYILSKRVSVSTGCEWGVFVTSDGVFAILHSELQRLVYIQVSALTTISVNTEYDIKITYDGSLNGNGVNITVDGVKPTHEISNVGTYIKMSNGTSPVYVGSRYAATNWLNGALTDIEIWKGVI